MPISEAMIIERRNWIGASDVGAILGLSKYASPHDLYLEKTGQLEPSPPSKAADAGNRFEAGVLDQAEETLGAIERNLHVKAIGTPFPLAANLDGRVLATGRPVESKTAGLFGPLSTDWDPDAIDGAPDMYHAQCQVHLMVTNKDKCHLPAFLGGVGFRMFEITRNEEFIKIILERCSEFWNYVTTRTAPPFSIPSLDVVKRIRRQPNKVISIPAEPVAVWLAAKDAESAAKKNKEAAEAAMLAAMGDAEGAECQIGRVTYNLTERDGYTVKPTSFRTLRFKKSISLSLGGTP